NGGLLLQVNDKLHTCMISQKSVAKPLQEAFQPSEYMELPDDRLAEFSMHSTREEKITGEAGEGTRNVVSETNSETGLTKELILTAYANFPGLITTSVAYINPSDKDVAVNSWVNNRYQLLSQGDEPPFWAFPGSSSGARADWIKPVTPGYYQKNY